MIKKYVVKTPVAYMHAQPKLSSEVTDELLYGTKLFGICDNPDEESSDMFYCETSYGYRGFISKKNLFAVSGTNKPEHYLITSRFCDVLVLPEYKFKPVFTLPFGSVVQKSTPVSSINGFTDIDFFGKNLFVRENCIQKKETLTQNTTEKQKRLSIVNTALSYLDTPYRHGGKSTFGIDCSGLCFMAYSLNGLPLWRDSVPDTRYVVQIPKEKLEKGDLIYYKGHVTMYIGENKYIHSSATFGKVLINSFDKDSSLYYEKLSEGVLLCAKSRNFVCKERE